MKESKKTQSVSSPIDVRFTQTNFDRIQLFNLIWFTVSNTCSIEAEYIKKYENWWESMNRFELTIECFSLQSQFTFHDQLIKNKFLWDGS